MNPATEAIETLIKDATRTVIDEAAPALVEQLVPIIIEHVRAAFAADSRTQGGATFVSVRMAADMMSVHTTTVRKLISDGKLGRYSVENQIRVKVADIHAYLGREGSPQPTIDFREKALAILRKAPSNNT